MRKAIKIGRGSRRDGGRDVRVVSEGKSIASVDRAMVAKKSSACRAGVETGYPRLSSWPQYTCDR